MTRIYFPTVTVPGTVRAGSLLDVWVMGVNLKIPPSDLVLFKEDVRIIRTFVLFDSNWVTVPIINAVNAIPNAVWDIFESRLNRWADEYARTHQREELQ